jgi:hypothetical protein
MHATAELNVRAWYEVWAKVFDGNISMNDYLESIISLLETGDRAKEVAELLKK